MKNNVSVIMPSLNEEKNITNAIKDVLYAFDKLNIEGEIIVVNDGSTDKTQLIVNELIKSYSNIKIINHNNPQGVGKSYWDGLKSSTYEIITWSPSDSENNTYEILRYLDLMKEVDIIIGLHQIYLNLLLTPMTLLFMIKKIKKLNFQDIELML